MLTLLIISVSTAIIISALCSICEAVLYSISNSQIELMKEKHPRRAAILAAMKENIEQPITAILTLNTIAHTIGASVAGAAAVAVFGKEGLLWFSIIFTAAILIFTEIIPKTIGVTYAKQLAAAISLPLKLMTTLLKPIIILCMAITNLIPKNNENQDISAEELQTIATLSLKSGTIGPEQEAVIVNILQLKEKTVREVMTPRTVTFMLDKDLTIKEALEFKDKWSIHSRVPVFNEDINEVDGIVLSRTFFMEAAMDNFATKLYEIMQPAHFIPETARLDTVFLNFFEQNQHLFIVVDEYGSMTGVITLEDIFEEIIGREIMDESDKTRDLRSLARKKGYSLETFTTNKQDG